MWVLLVVAACPTLPRDGLAQAAAARRWRLKPDLALARPGGATASRQALGMIVVVADPPDAAVRVDGRPIEGGSARVALGRHRVEIVAPGRASGTAVADVQRAGQVVRVRAVLPRAKEGASSLAAGFASRRGELLTSDMRPPAPAGEGELSVESSPQAMVLLDGDSIGGTPLKGRSVPSGQYFLRLSRRGFSDAGRVITLGPHQSLSLQFVLTPAATR